jgi:hypothetical protein
MQQIIKQMKGLWESSVCSQADRNMTTWRPITCNWCPKWGPALWGMCQFLVVSVQTQNWYKIIGRSGMVAQTCNPSTWVAEARRLWVWGQPGLHSEVQTQKKKKIDRRHQLEHWSLVGEKHTFGISSIVSKPSFLCLAKTFQICIFMILDYPSLLLNFCFFLSLLP